MLNAPKVGKPRRYSFHELRTAFPKRLPHYKIKETEILNRFIKLGHLVGDYVFDFRLPYELTEGEKLLPVEEQRMLVSLKSMRIDAVVETPNEIWIVEVAKGLELSYTGKLLGYTLLYKKLFKPMKPIKMAVVAVKDNVMARWALEELGTKIWIVSP